MIELVIRLLRTSVVSSWKPNGQQDKYDKEKVVDNQSIIKEKQR